MSFFPPKDILRPDCLWAPSSGDMKSECCICGLLRFKIHHRETEILKGKIKTLVVVVAFSPTKAVFVFVFFLNLLHLGESPGCCQFY